MSYWGKKSDWLPAGSEDRFVPAPSPDTPFVSPGKHVRAPQDEANPAVSPETPALTAVSIEEVYRLLRHPPRKRAPTPTTPSW